MQAMVPSRRAVSALFRCTNPQNLEWLEARRLLVTVVGFEDLEIGPAGDSATGIYDDPTGFRFKLEASAGFATGDAPQIFGAAHGFASNVIHPAEWLQRFLITRTDGRPFDFLGLDYGASRFGDGGDFTLSAFLADGSHVSEVVSFSGDKSLLRLEREIEEVTELRISFAGGANHAYGALDNFVFDEPTPPTVLGSLADPDPVAGPARLAFDERDWHEVDHLAPLPDGSFYAFGRSGEETQPLPRVPPAERTDPENVTAWVTKHFPDGSIDRSFGDHGRIAAEDLPWDGFDYTLTPIGDGHFIGIVRTASDEHLALFDSDLQRVTSFADEGILRPGRPIESFASFEDGGLVISTTDPADEPILAIYSPAGVLVRSALLEPLNDEIYPLEEGRRSGGLAASGNHGTGHVFLAVLLQPPDVSDFDLAFAGVARLKADLQLDTSYGVAGVAQDKFVSPMEGLSLEAIFVGSDGRALIGIEEADSDSDLTVFTPDGEVVGRSRYFSTASFSGTPDARMVAVSFLPSDDIGVAFSFTDFQLAMVTIDSSNLSTGFAVHRLDFGEPSGGTRIEEFFNPGLPANMNHAFATASGGFILAGFVEDVTLEVDEEFEQQFITAIDHHGALWHTDFSRTRVDFEDVPTGFIDSGTLVRHGFTFSSIPGNGGPQSEPLRVDGPSQGYDSNVLSTLNWGRRIDVRRQDTSVFSLQSFDYAAGRWNEPGDFILTGHFADGTTLSQTASFSTRQLDTLELNWTNLQSFDINFAGGINEAYGAVDNFVFPGSAP